MPSPVRSLAMPSAPSPCRWEWRGPCRGRGRPATSPRQLERNAFQALPVHVAHAVAVITLPDVHRDPFDPMLVAQEISDGLTIVSSDPDLARYPIPVVW